MLKRKLEIGIEKGESIKDIFNTSLEENKEFFNFVLTVKYRDKALEFFFDHTRIACDMMSPLVMVEEGKDLGSRKLLITIEYLPMCVIWCYFSHLFVWTAGVFLMGARNGVLGTAIVLGALFFLVVLTSYYYLGGRRIKRILRESKITI